MLKLVMELINNYLTGEIYAGQSLKIVIYILLINFTLALVYFLVSIFKKNYSKAFLMTMFMILTPPVGLIYLGVSWAINEIYFKRNPGVLSLEELSMSKDKVELIHKDDLNEALNKVPLEEALIISASQNSRRLLLDILKEDTDAYIDTIYKAKEDSDSEVSHYAATAIADILDKFKEKEMQLRGAYLANLDDLEIGDLYQDFLSTFLQENILSPIEQERYAGILEDLVISLEKNTPELVRGETYYKLLDIFIDLDNLEKAEYWVDKALKDPEKDLESYKAGLKFYYITAKREAFFTLLEELKSSSIRLDQETLEKVRFYSY